MKKTTFIFTVLLLMGLLLVACSTSSGEPQILEVTRIVEVQGETVIETVIETVVETVVQTVEIAAPDTPTGHLIVSVSTFPNSIYSANAAERNAANVAQQIFSGLTWVDEEGNIVPALAERWEISEDGLEYTFHLRQGVTFHNGANFVAQDVLTSWEAGKDPTNAYYYDYEDASAVEVIDDYTVKMVTPDTNPLFLRKLSGWAIVPTDYFNEVGLAGVEAHPVGTGPFQFVEQVQGDRIVLEAFPDYWEEGLPKLARITFRPIPESSTRVAAVQTGEIHIANRLSSTEAQQLLGARGVTVVRYPVDRVYYIAFNNLTSGVDTPLEDPLVRQALNYAVDRQAIIDALFDGFASLSTGFMTPGNLGYNADLEPYAFDPELAQDLLAEAGYEGGFEIGFACPSDAYTNFDLVCQAVGGYLQDVGITFSGGEIQFMESGQYWDLEATKALPPLFGDSWSTADGEALNRLTGALGGENASYSAWWTPEIQDYLTQISTTVDPEARAQLYSDFHQLLYDDPPFIYLYEPNTFEAINSAVQNYTPRAAENYYLKAVFLASE